VINARRNKFYFTHIRAATTTVVDIVAEVVALPAMDTVAATAVVEVVLEEPRLMAEEPQHMVVVAAAIMAAPVVLAPLLVVAHTQGVEEEVVAAAVDLSVAPILVPVSHKSISASTSWKSLKKIFTSSIRM